MVATFERGVDPRVFGPTAKIRDRIGLGDTCSGSVLTHARMPFAPSLLRALTSNSASPNICATPCQADLMSRVSKGLLLPGEFQDEKPRPEIISPTRGKRGTASSLRDGWDSLSNKPPGNVFRARKLRPAWLFRSLSSSISHFEYGLTQYCVPRAKPI
jgi:hypothetical protein